MGIRAFIKKWLAALAGKKIESGAGVKIIKTTTRHVRAIHALEKECFSDPWSIEALKYEITNPQSVCLVAVNESKKILGHITMRHVLDEGHINNIAVTAAARRQGTGRRLLEAIISESAALGITSITLEVRSKNHAAISLYEKLGFVTCGCRKDYYRKPTDDALVMRKGEPQR